MCKAWYNNLILIFCVLFLCFCRKAEETKNEDDLNDWYSGGKQTVFVTGSGAFSQSFNGLSELKLQQHEIGDRGFAAVFNSDPNQLNYGLGPLFNNVSCGSCHIGDGRGKAPSIGEPLSSLLLRISTSNDINNGPQTALGFGGQLQQRAILGTNAECDIAVNYTETAFQFADGETYSLRTPIYTLNNAYTTLPAGYLISARMATPVFGLGLLEAISEPDILKNADEFDANGDGISGKANYGFNVVENKKQLGRFGWKAAMPTIIQQSAGAYNQDMGVTSFIFPIESSYGQPQYNLSNGKKDLADSTISAVGFYIKTLAVPGRRDTNTDEVKKGKNIFKQIGCAKCHIQTFITQTDMTSPETSNQRIFPFTDMLVHDMGNGLADNRNDYNATGNEWRTSPLWGIGLTNIVNGHNNFLHDGRARNFIEAIMWHGGEANTVQNNFKNLSKPERDAVIKFLNSL